MYILFSKQATLDRKRLVGHKRSSSLLEKIGHTDIRFSFEMDERPLDKSRITVQKDSDFNTTHMYLTEIEKKVRANKRVIKRQNLNINKRPESKAKQKLNLMRRLKPTPKDIDVFSTDSD